MFVYVRIYSDGDTVYWVLVMVIGSVARTNFAG